MGLFKKKKKKKKKKRKKEEEAFEAEADSLERVISCVNLSVGSASQTVRQSRFRDMELTGSSEGKPCRVSHWIEQQRRKWKEMKLPAQPEVPRV